MALEKRGYILRDYESYPETYNLPRFASKYIPSTEWRERIDYMNSIRGQCFYWHKALGDNVVMNQRNTNYCWMYGTVAAIKNCYATQGVGNLNLNAHAVAYMGKRGRNVGGFGAEACDYIMQYGIPQQSALPEFTRTLRWDRLVRADASRHNIVAFSEIGRNNFEGVVSTLLADDPAPCTVAFDWWGHLVCALAVTYDKNGQFGLVVVNSYGKKWGAGGESKGYGVVWGDKAVPFESIAVRNVRARSESDG